MDLFWINVHIPALIFIAGWALPVLDSGALLSVDSGALLLIDSGALLLSGGGALLFIDSWTLLFVDWKKNSFHLFSISVHLAMHFCFCQEIIQVKNKTTMTDTWCGKNSLFDATILDVKLRKNAFYFPMDCLTLLFTN